MRWLVCFVALGLSAAPRFRIEEIAKYFGVGYAIQIADMNGDDQPDVLAINPAKVVWHENSNCSPHLILV